MEKSFSVENLYKPEHEREHLSLDENQKNAVRAITLGIEEVDETIREMAVLDVVATLENGHSLNRLVVDEKGETIGFIACEDFVPHEAYIKYFGTSGQTGRSLLREIPAFLEYAKQQGYTKVNFHGWNHRLNHILERYGFERLRTDDMADFSVDFYEKTLVEQKSPEAITEERKKAFEDKYLMELNLKYNQIMASFGKGKELEKNLITESFKTLDERLSKQENFEFGDRQKAILKLKLARYFQHIDWCDLNTLFDAIIESPKFINTDKGSLHRLLEVHQEKTLQKIAEMRKKRAEMGDKEAFNPYENLFTTKSGDYYLARLLNMPHLEEESEYMNHCVGTSDSYINQMKRGDIEIFSFRHMPAINRFSQKLEDGLGPVMTIEYNCRTKVIEQIKKSNDAYLNSDDPYFDDVVDALKQLRATKTDSRELRDFKSISPSELENIKVPDYQVLTDQGKISFRDFNTENGAFILKMGEIEITPEMPKQDVAQIVRIVEGISCKPEEIAQGPEEITEATKVYLGKLTPEIIRLDIENIYSSFPEGKIQKYNIEIGGKTKKELKAELQSKGIYVYPYACDLLDSPDFTTSKNIESKNLVRLTVGALGFTSSPTIDQIYKRAEELGLGLCPAEVGPRLRLSYSGGDWMWIAMKQITDRDRGPKIFCLDHDADELILYASYASPGGQWALGSKFVFSLRKA